MSAALTRRAALSGAVASVAMVGVAAAAAMPLGASTGGISAKFAALLNRAQQASDAADHHDETVARPAYERFTAAVAKIEAETPHFSIDAGKRADGERLIWSTDSLTSIAMTKTYVQMAREGRSWPTQGIAAARKVQAAHLRRQRTIVRATAQARITTRVGEANKDNEALGDALYEAQNAVVDFPVQCAADLAAKIDRIIAWDLSDRLDELLTDARRLAKMEG